MNYALDIVASSTWLVARHRKRLRLLVTRYLLLIETPRLPSDVS